MTFSQILSMPIVGKLVIGALVAGAGLLGRAFLKYIHSQIESEQALQKKLASDAASADAQKLHTDTANLLQQLDHFASIAAGDVTVAFGEGVIVLAGDPTKSKAAVDAGIKKIRALGGADLPTQLEGLLGIGAVVAEDYLGTLVRAKLIGGGAA